MNGTRLVLVPTVTAVPGLNSWQGQTLSSVFPSVVGWNRHFSALAGRPNSRAVVAVNIFNVLSCSLLNNTCALWRRPYVAEDYHFHAPKGLRGAFHWNLTPTGSGVTEDRAGRVHVSVQKQGEGGELVSESMWAPAGLVVKPSDGSDSKWETRRGAWRKEPSEDKCTFQQVELLMSASCRHVWFVRVRTDH